jgi:hypothetical protein
MIANAIRTYETEVGAVRHRENSSKFDRLFEMLNQLIGAYTLGKLTAAFIAFMVTAIFALLMYLTTTRKTAGLAISAPIVASSTNATAQ